jgi:glutamyl-tRNA reductase
LHRKRNGNALALDVPIWSTCLRQIAFIKKDEFTLVDTAITAAADDEIFEGDDAVEFLLNVICGLKSPVLGETEVQGQFKQFISENILFQRELRGWGEALLAQAKRIRLLHLENLGAGSYGSWLRKKIAPQSSVGIVGSGHLVGEILPWFKQVERVTLFVRSIEKCNALKELVPSLEVQALDQVGSESQLVIAAPVSNQWILERAKNYLSPCQFLDFRGEAALDRADLKRLAKLGHSYTAFSQILADIENERGRVRERVAKADVEIQTAVRSLHQRLWLRPGGWEDLCG